MKAIMDRDFEINEKIADFLNKQEGKIKLKIIKDSTSTGLEYFMNEKVKEFQKNFLSKKIYIEILKPDKDNDPFDVDLKLGRSDYKNKKLENYFDYLHVIFKAINLQLNGVSLILNEKKEYFNKLSANEISYVMKMVERRTDRLLAILKRYLEIGNNEKLFLRVGTSITATMDVENE
jgi:hypothetical protein